MSRYLYALAALAALSAAPTPVLADDPTVVVYGRISNFPGQQLCQVDRSDRRYRDLCWPQSYHPLGYFGYRPLGTYQPYRSVRRFWIQPSAKIVRIDPNN